jgi:two-component system, chemotaxis family, chemotaxis protein CheY
MKVLIVDDSRAMRMIVARILKQTGVATGIDEAENGLLALAHLRSTPTDLVISDWNMPEMSGIELLRALRGEGIGVPFVFVTSESTSEMRALAEEAGAASLIAKPFTREVLESQLTALAV